MAQWLKHTNGKAIVGGSNPAVVTNFLKLNVYLNFQFLYYNMSSSCSWPCSVVGSAGDSGSILLCSIPSVAESYTTRQVEGLTGYGAYVSLPNVCACVDVW